MSRVPARIYVDPPSHHFLEDRLFDPAMARYGGDDLLAPHRAVRDHFEAAGIPVHTADRLETAPVDDVPKLYVSLGHLGLYRRLANRPDTVPSAFFAFECPIVEPGIYRAFPDLARHFKRIYSWTRPECLERFTGRRVPTERFFWPQSFDAVHEELWAREVRSFLVMINSNKLPRVYWQELYTERLRAVEFFHRFGEIDLYGPNWDRMPNRVGKTWVPATARRVHGHLWRAWRKLVPHPLYRAAAGASRGLADSKSETLASYRFALCFENMILDGWITEKIFDCFFAGTVPVYLGAPDITEWIPSETFVDMRDFGGYDELRSYLHGLDGDRIAEYRQAARDFLGSDAFSRFHMNTYVDHFRSLVREDLGIETPGPHRQG